MAEKNLRISGGAVRFGATYGGNKLFSGRSQGGAGGASLALSKSLSMGGAGGAGLGLRARGGQGLGGGMGLGMGLGGGMGLGMGLGGGMGLGMGLGGGMGLGLGGGGGAGVGGRGGMSAGVAPLRARLGGPVFKIGGYGFNPSFISSTTSVEAGAIPLSSIDPTLPSIDTVQVTRLKEKEELQVLNDKFASFIDKARSLEQQNAVLKAKISMFTNPMQGGPASTSIILTSAIGAYKTQIDSLAANKEAIVAEIEYYKHSIDEIQAKFEEETAQTKTLEMDWTTLKEDVDNLYLNIFELQTSISGLEDELSLSKQVYDAKVKEVRNIVMGSVKSAFSISVDNAAQAMDLTSALSDVKAHYEALAQRSKKEALSSAQDSVSMMSITTQPSTQSLTQTKEEVRVYKFQIDSVHREIDRLKTMNIQMESQVEEAESQSNSIAETYQEQAMELKSQLEDIRKQISHYGQEYQELLASKMSLDVEITAYKKLLDSEEIRIKSGGGVTVHKTSIGGGGGAGAAAGLSMGGSGLGGGVGSSGGLGLGQGGGYGYGMGLGSGFGGGLGGGLGLGGGAESYMSSSFSSSALSSAVY